MKRYYFNSITVLILAVMFLTGTIVNAKKRINKLSLEDLKNKNSPSYVPIPYPKNRKELLEDMRYAIKSFLIPKPGQESVSVHQKKNRHKVLIDWAEGKSKFKFKRIIKVKNLRSGYYEDFYWLAIMVDSKNQIIARVMMQANGLLGLFSSSPCRELPVPYTEKPEKKILKKLSRIIGKSLDERSTKSMEPIELGPPLGHSLSPAFQISLKDGQMIYFSPVMDQFFMVKKKIPWNIDEKGHRSSPFEKADRSELKLSAFDEINDLIYIFEELTPDDK